jgi:acetoin utilization deacetylase AcuC-like enzyme
MTKSYTTACDIAAIYSIGRRQKTLHRTGVVIDPRYQNHLTGAGHPDQPRRIAAVMALLDDYDRHDLRHLEPRAATPSELALNHDQAHVERVAATASQPSFAFDADTPVSAQSYDTALLAAGGLLELLDAVIDGEVDNGFALVRPPGHHAESDRAMGFCLFNNVAVGARYLIDHHGFERVLIVDWDVHHGNGTQHSFAADPAVLYVSTHQHPYYPGTGAAHEVGVGDAEGATVNLPLPAGCGDPEYLHLFARVIDPICRQFAPQFVLISAGFDAHLRDPMAAMRVSTDGFGAMARCLLRIAEDLCQGRCAAVLEGGYDLEALGASVLRVLDEMGGEEPFESIPPTEAAERLTDWIWSVQDRYWDRPAA